MHPSWGPYPDTVLHFPDAALRIDLRRPVPPSARSALAGLGLAGPFAVVTAANPLGIPLGSAPNRRLAAWFGEVVRLEVAGPVRADGESPDGTHVEAGFALRTTPAEARSLAARFFQNAFFWYDGDRFFIKPALTGTGDLALPRGTEQP